MTPEELAKLTPEEKRIRIAELHDGWRWKFESENDYVVIKETGSTVMRYYPSHPQDIAECLDLAGIPDYLNDLNAMHEAERQILVEYRDGHKWRDYRNDYSDRLWFVCAPIRSKEESGWGFPHFATAAQRADAFLLCLSPDAPRPTGSGVASPKSASAASAATPKENQ